jgi:hypothetical protein
MPIGLRRLEASCPGGLPFAWGVNGIASVVASVLAICVGIVFGFSAATLLAGGCYAVALAAAVRGLWPAASARVSEAADVPEAWAGRPAERPRAAAPR